MIFERFKICPADRGSNGIVRKGKALHTMQRNSMEVTGNELPRKGVAMMRKEKSCIELQGK